MGLLKSFPNQRTFYPPYLYAHNLLFENGVQALQNVAIKLFSRNSILKQNPFRYS